MNKTVNRYFSLVRPYILTLTVCIMAMSIAAGIELSLPLAIKYIFDTIMNHGDVSLVYIAAGGMLVLFAIRLLLSYWGRLRLNIIGDTITCNLRNTFFAHIQTQSLYFYTNITVGDLLSRLNNGISAIRTILATIPASFILESLTLIGATVIMLTMNWKLGCLVILVTPITTVLARFYGHVFHHLSANIQDTLARSNNVAKDTLSGIETVKLIHCEQCRNQAFAAATRDYFSVAVQTRKASALYTALVAFVGSASTIGIFWYGGVLVFSHKVSAGSLIAFLLYSQNVTSSISALGGLYARLRQSNGTCSEVFRILDMHTGIRDCRDAVDLGSRLSNIMFDKVTFGYRSGQVIIDNLTFSARSGEIIGITGPSGSGKSTVLKLLTRLYDVDKGSIRINGIDIRKYTQESLHKAIAIVPQDVFLFDASIADNIRIGRPGATISDIESAATIARATEFIEQLPNGFDSVVGERGAKLSGGQRQRIAIARAILNRDATVLILDEATSAVDETSERLIQDAIREICCNRTVFVCAHRASTVRHVDRRIVLKAVQGERRA